MSCRYGMLTMSGSHDEGTINDGDPMNTTIQQDTPSRRIGWLAGTVGGLLLISLGLEFIAHQVFGETDAATLILTLYLAFWISGLGVIGFLVLSIRWFVEWRRGRMDRTAHLEDHECLRPGWVSVAPRRLVPEGQETGRSYDFNRVV